MKIFIVLSAIMWTAIFIRGGKNTYRTGGGGVIGLFWLYLIGIVTALGWLIIFEVIK